MPEVWQRNAASRSLHREPGYIHNPKVFPFEGIRCCVTMGMLIPAAPY